MKISEISELHLAVLVAGATFLGGFVSSLLGVFLVDAGTEKQTDVQLVQLAVGILSEAPSDMQPANVALRGWAVDTINAAAEVKFDETAKQQLIDGRLDLPWKTAKMIELVSQKFSELPTRPSSIELQIEGGPSFRIQDEGSQDEGSGEQPQDDPSRP